MHDIVHCKILLLINDDPSVSLTPQYFFPASLESRITLVGLAYWHIIFAQSLKNGSLKSSIREAVDSMKLAWEFLRQGACHVESKTNSAVR